MYRDLPEETGVFICPHIAYDDAEICVIATEPDSDMSMTCGCIPSDAEIAHYVHLLPKLSDDILDKEVVIPGQRYWRLGPGLPWMLKDNPNSED